MVRVRRYLDTNGQMAFHDPREVSVKEPVKPVQETVEKEVVQETVEKEVVKLETLSLQELRRLAVNKGVKFHKNINKVSLISKIEESEEPEL